MLVAIAVQIAAAFAALGAWRHARVATILGAGGAIFNADSLHLDGGDFTQNFAIGGSDLSVGGTASGGEADGAILYNSGDVVTWLMSVDGSDGQFLGYLKPPARVEQSLPDAIDFGLCLRRAWSVAAWRHRERAFCRHLDDVGRRRLG